MSDTQIVGLALRQSNVGAFIKRVHALVYTKVGAGVGGSGTAIKGSGVNRVDPHVSLSAFAALPVSCVLASGNTATFARKIQHSDTDSDGAYADYGTAPANYVVTAANAGGAVNDDVGKDWNIDLSGAKIFVRIVVTPTLSASGSDTAHVGNGSLCLGGFDVNPNSDVQ